MTLSKKSYCCSSAVATEVSIESHMNKRIVIDGLKFDSFDNAVSYLVNDGMTSRGAYDYIMSGVYC